MSERGKGPSELARKLARVAVAPMEGEPLRFDVALEMATVNVAARLDRELAPLLEQAIEAIESGQAGIWDSYYGQGIAVEYARSVDSKARAALSSLRAAVQGSGEVK